MVSREDLCAQERKFNTSRLLPNIIRSPIAGNKLFTELKPTHTHGCRNEIRIVLDDENVTVRKAQPRVVADVVECGLVRGVQQTITC